MDRELGPGAARASLHKHVGAQTGPSYQGGHTVYVRPPTLRHTAKGGGANPSLLCNQLPSLPTTPALRIKRRVKRLCIKAWLSRHSSLFCSIGPGRLPSCNCASHVQYCSCRIQWRIRNTLPSQRAIAQACRPRGECKENAPWRFLFTSEPLRQYS